MIATFRRAARRGHGMPGLRVGTRRTRHRRGVVPALVAAVLGLALAACSGTEPTDAVTVTAGETSVVVPAALSCYAPSGGTELACAGGENDDDAPHLALAPGTPLTVTVSRTVSDTPWVIVFASVDAQGQPQSDRTAVFAPQKQTSYRLEPGAGVQLTRLEVQSLTAAPSDNGGVEFPAIGTWVLVIDPPATAQP